MPNTLKSYQVPPIRPPSIRPAYDNFQHAVGGPASEQLYQEQIAEAKRDHAVAIAHAQRNLTVTGDQSAYDATIQSANADLEADELAAARDYAIAEIGAQGGRDITLQSENAALDSTEGVAHLARVDNIMGHWLRRCFSIWGGLHDSRLGATLSA